MTHVDRIAERAWNRTHRPRYLTAAETAKLVRAALKRAFPGVRFSVRTHTYSGGASISVRWTDGPRYRDVAAVTAPFEGKRFDGMIDLGYGVTHYLRPDGSVLLAHDPGTQEAGGLHPGDDNRDLAVVLPDDAELVHFGADSVSCSRDVSDYGPKVVQALSYLRTHCDLDDAGRRFGNWWVDDVASAMARDYLPGEDWADTFQRFVNR